MGSVVTTSPDVSETSVTHRRAEGGCTTAVRSSHAYSGSIYVVMPLNTDILVKHATFSTRLRGTKTKFPRSVFGAAVVSLKSLP